MEPTELLRLVGERLDRLGCERFTTGSLASMVFGEPRFTNDIDIVVRMDERQEATSMLRVSPVSVGSRCPTVASSHFPLPRM